MKLSRLEWDSRNIEHITRHGVTPEEVMQAVRIAPKVRRGRCGRYLVLGRTAAGRHLLVVLAPSRPGRAIARAITARDMDDRERALYRRK